MLSPNYNNHVELTESSVEFINGLRDGYLAQFDKSWNGDSCQFDPTCNKWPYLLYLARTVEKSPQSIYMLLRKNLDLDSNDDGMWEEALDFSIKNTMVQHLLLWRLGFFLAKYHSLSFPIKLSKALNENLDFDKAWSIAASSLLSDPDKPIANIEFKNIHPPWGGSYFDPIWKRLPRKFLWSFFKFLKKYN